MKLFLDPSYPGNFMFSPDPFLQKENQQKTEKLRKKIRQKKKKKQKHFETGACSVALGCPKT